MNFASASLSLFIGAFFFFTNVLDPLGVLLEAVGREANDVHVALLPLILEGSNETQLGGADRS